MMGLWEISLEPTCRNSEIILSLKKCATLKDYLLKAAGTPMIKALPVMVSLKLTLLPGEFSTRTSRFGSVSPILMKARAEEWNLKIPVGREALRAARRRTVVETILVDLVLMLVQIVADGGLIVVRNQNKIACSLAFNDRGQHLNLSTNSPHPTHTLHLHSLPQSPTPAASSFL